MTLISRKTITLSGCAGDQTEEEQTVIAHAAVVCDHDKVKGK
jgi:hypothetical protein